jgi:hypothetical protein
MLIFFPHSITVNSMTVVITYHLVIKFTLQLASLLVRQATLGVVFNESTVRCRPYAITNNIPYAFVRILHILWADSFIQHLMSWRINMPFNSEL